MYQMKVIMTVTVVKCACITMYVGYLLASQLLHSHLHLQHIVQGMPKLNLPDVCNEAPLYGQAFCASHCTFLKEQAPAVPTGLKDFFKYCGVVRKGT